MFIGCKSLSIKKIFTNDKNLLNIFKRNISN